VPASFSVSNLGDSAVLGSGSLRRAIMDANNSMDETSTIMFNSGLSGTITLESALEDLKKNITIGAGGDSVRVVCDSGNPLFTIFTIDATWTCEIEGLSIEWGRQGVSNGGYLTLSEDTISNNIGGGGIVNDGSLTVDNCYIEYNQTLTNGGGIYNINGQVYCCGCVISSNFAAGFGGGIANDSAIASVTLSGGCNVDYNEATSYGGGIYNLEGTVNMDGGTLTYNTTGQDGGGLYSDTGATETLTSVDITNNSAANGNGGGFCLLSGTATFNMCTISGNNANTGPGGAWKNPGSSYQANSCTITDTIVTY